MSNLQLDSIEVIDISADNERLKIAQQLIAENYARFSSNPICVEDVYTELCTDIYEQMGVVRTFLVIGEDIDSPVNPVVLSTNRIVLGSQAHKVKGVPPLEIMDLTLVPEGWENFRFADFSLHISGEFGRYAIAYPYRTQDCAIEIFRKLMAGSIQISKTNYGVEQFWAMMPKYVVRQLSSIGIKAIPVPELQFNTDKHADYFARYDKYWYHSKPWFYRILV